MERADGAVVGEGDLGEARGSRMMKLVMEQESRKG